MHERIAFHIVVLVSGLVEGISLLRSALTAHFFIKR